MVTESARKRVAKRQKNIVQRVGATESELRKIFRVQGQTTFWEKLSKLTSKLVDSHGWQAILEALKTAQKRRKDGLLPGSNRSKAWQPMDVGNAAESLSNTASSHTEGNTTSMNTSHYIVEIPSTPPPAAPSSPMALPENRPQRDPSLHIVFFDLTNSKNIAEDLGFRSLTVNPTDPFFRGAMMNTLTAQALSELESNVGSGLCSNNSPAREDGRRGTGNSPENSPESTIARVHGIVLTLLWVKHEGSVSVEFRDRHWLRSMLHENSQEDYLEAFDKSVQLFTHMRRPHMTESLLADAASDLAALDAAIENAHARSRHEIKSYPGRSEAQADRTRISDMRILDEIAKHTSTPKKYSFRPKSCYGYAGECQMKGFEGQVVVRCSSSRDPGSTEIKKSDNPQLNRLLKCTCTSAPHRGRNFAIRKVPCHSFPPLPRYRYSHQELIPTLLNWGEIHVIMVGSKHFCACIRHGNYGDKDSFVSAVIADRCFKEWKRFDENAENVTTAEAEAKVDELEVFCRWWRERLIKHKPELFETFKVAVRFDIGISKIGADAQFFINEMPRWPGADFLSSFMDFSYPHYEIYQAIGQKFAVECESMVAREREQLKDEPVSDPDLYGDD